MGLFSAPALVSTIWAAGLDASALSAQNTPPRDADMRVWSAAELGTASTAQLAGYFLPGLSEDVISSDWRRLSLGGAKRLSFYERPQRISDWACRQKVHRLTFAPSWEFYPQVSDPTGSIHADSYEEFLYRIPEAGSCEALGADNAGFRAYDVDVSQALRLYQAAVDDDAPVVCDGDRECGLLFRAFDIRTLSSLSNCRENSCVARFRFPASEATRRAGPYGWDLTLFTEPHGYRVVIRASLPPAPS